MLSIFAVYDSKENVSRWVIANDEGFSWQTADTISSELQLDSDDLYNKIVLGSWQWDSLICDPCWDQHLFDDDEFELYKYCQFEFYKKDCKYFNTKYRLGTNELPTDLFNKLTPEYIAWANLEGVGCLTDGYDVFMDDSYEPPVEPDPKELTDMKEFYRWFNDLQYNEPLRDNTQCITIAVAGNSVKIPFHADSYELLDRFLTKAIEEF
jgi:hypothetical protein